MIRSSLTFAALAGLLLPACSESKKPGKGEDDTPSPVREAPATQDKVKGSKTAGNDANHPPHFEIPAWTDVGVGQEIGFGLEMVDEESDTVTVELIESPPSASYDPQTLTVVWKPSKADKPAAKFRVRMTEVMRANGKKRVFEHEFHIRVLDRKQPKPTAQPLSSTVEQLVTIHDRERLAKVNAEWPIDKLLAHGAAQYIKTLPASGKKSQAPDPSILYKDMLSGLAKANHNPRVDPASPDFDKTSFGDPRSWELIAVRPRLDKKWHEVRLVYKAQKAHAATYAMFKWRPSTGSAPASARAENNKLFSEMVFKHFFSQDGTLNKDHAKNKKAHADAVAGFVRDVVTYQGDKGHSVGTFLGLPMEARLGGGSKMKDGKYESGDGWGWNVQKVKVGDDGVAHMKNVPIKGFSTGIVANNGQWTLACASPLKTEARKGLCRDSGHSDMPAMGDGYDPHDGSDAKYVSSKVDAANLFLEYKDKWMVESVPLRDPRRDLFEEKGMTCSQCHVRSFGVRDMYDQSAYDPKAGTPTKLNKRQATTFFVLTPTERWQPYAIDFQHKQACKFKTSLEKDLGRNVTIACPLKVE